MLPLINTVSSEPLAVKMSQSGDCLQEVHSNEIQMELQWMLKAFKMAISQFVLSFKLYFYHLYYSKGYRWSILFG